MRHITLSTVGVVPNIDRLAAEDLQLTLAVSLHAPTDALRTRLVPVNKTYPLDKLMPACRRYAEATGRRLTFEYVLLREVNDRPEDARALAHLLQKHCGPARRDQRDPVQPDQPWRSSSRGPNRPASPPSAPSWSGRAWS